MLTAGRYAWENRIPQAPWTRTCVSTGRSPETSGPSSPECTDPQRWATVAEATPRHERGVLRARLLRPAGRHAMVVAHFFESGQRRRLRWAESRGPPNGRAVALAQHRVPSLDRPKRPGRGHVGSGPGVQGSPQREPALPRRQLESRVREAQGRVILLERGLDRSPVAAAGDRL